MTQIKVTPIPVTDSVREDPGLILVAVEESGVPWLKVRQHGLLHSDARARCHECHTQRINEGDGHYWLKGDRSICVCSACVDCGPVACEMKHD